MAAKTLIYITNEHADCNIPLLWKRFEENRELESLKMTIRSAISEENSHLFDEWCRFFGFKLKSIEVESRPPLEKSLDPKAFDSLTSFIAVHEHNYPVSKTFLSYLSKFSPAIENLSIRCEPEALAVIGSFSRLLNLNISLVTPWWLSPDELDVWTEKHVTSVLPGQFNQISQQLQKFVIYARRVRVPWSLMNLSNLMELDVDTGLFQQLLCLTHGRQLKKLTYAYYGSEFCVSEIDDWEVLMEHMHKLSSVRLRISSHFKDRVDAINWIATFAEDWPNTTFKVDDYWGDDFVADVAEGKNLIYQTRSKAAATAAAGGSVCILRMENLLAKVPIEDRKHFARFKTITSW